MPLLGQAAMLLSFDVLAEAISEHDDWHTHEHLPERLSIPGFIRGSRWVALHEGPRYLVIYEVAELATLTSHAYLQRLNNPTEWTSKMMRYYQGMSRGLCTVTGSFGLGMGHIALLIRFRAEMQTQTPLREWVLRALPPLLSKPGVGSIHLLEQALAAPMTSEQQIRGADANVGWAIVVNGYSEDALAKITQANLNRESLEQHGAIGAVEAMYRMDYSLLHDELA